MSTEHAETLRVEKLIAFRRLGYNRVHFALVMPGALETSQHFGAPCTFVAAPVAALCARTLRGRLVEIPTEYLDGWKNQGRVCRECRMVARFALERLER